MINVDFGVTLKAYGPDGVVDIPKLKPRRPARTEAEKFADRLALLLEQDDVCVESATVGSSGAEPQLIEQIVNDSFHNLYVISGRAMKNYVKGLGLDAPGSNNQLAAQYQHELITKNPAALKLWKPATSKLTRIHRSARPYDKRDYQGPQCDQWMGHLCPYENLSSEAQAVFGAKGEYSRAKVINFGQAFEEEGSSSRSGYEKIIGLYAHGYPSRYRRATVDIMQSIAKNATGKAHFADVTDEERKDSWKVTRRIIRELHAKSKAGTLDPETGIYHLADSAGTLDPETGTVHPALSSKKI
jgi:hypothetical protein